MPLLNENVALTLVISVITFLVVDCATPDIHGGIKMGIPNKICDNARDNLSVDWDNTTNVDYVCLRNEDYIPVTKSDPVIDCLPKENFPKPLHKCMHDKIVYDDPPPRAGPHRPLWPVYGRYLYVPPQRWIHSLEHGAAVFLYHPCGNFGEIEKLVETAKSCLRRYIITPYKALPAETPYAVVTYGCRLMMSSVDEDTVKTYIKAHALKDAPERVSRNGQYSLGLLEKSQIVKGSNKYDSNLCPTQETTTKRNIQLDDDIDNLLHPFN